MALTMAAPACEDCKWCQLRPTPYCFHPQSYLSVFNPYQANNTMVVQTDRAMRSTGACRPAGILFEMGSSNVPLSVSNRPTPAQLRLLRVNLGSA